MRARFVASLLVVLAGLPAAGTAGIGRLVSRWMSRAPAIDGQVAALEWSEAEPVELGAGISLWIGNDARTLYLALVDSADQELDSGDGLYFYFDDEGGIVPVRDDDVWTNALCGNQPEVGEGGIELNGFQQVIYEEYVSEAACSNQVLTARVRYRAAARPNGVIYEIAIPLDGPAPLRAGPGERFAVYLQVYRNGNEVACLPACQAFDPATFRNLILASAGCNTGPQRLGAAVPLHGLPLDWTTEMVGGFGQAWRESLIGGMPSFCGGNVTGGDGAAACVSNVHYASEAAESALHLPLSLAGQGWATVRFLANFQLGAAGDTMAFGTRHEFIPFWSLLYWPTSHGDPAGPGVQVEVELPLWLNNFPLDFTVRHGTATAGLAAGGFGQVDDIELRCGPILFGDGFESGLTTHWSATSP